MNNRYNPKEILSKNGTKKTKERYEDPNVKLPNPATKYTRTHAAFKSIFLGTTERPAVNQETWPKSQAGDRYLGT